MIEQSKTNATLQATVKPRAARLVERGILIFVIVLDSKRVSVKRAVAGSRPILAGRRVDRNEKRPRHSMITSGPDRGWFGCGGKSGQLGQEQAG